MLESRQNSQKTMSDRSQEAAQTLATASKYQTEGKVLKSGSKLTQHFLNSFEIKNSPVRTLLCLKILLLANHQHHYPPRKKQSFLLVSGPLGQGITNVVGLALAERHLVARYNKPDADIVDYYTYCILGDGCQMEGIANAAFSLAGHWGLGKLIVFYDDNHILIDGDTEIAFTESVDTCFEALGWHIIWVKNGNTGYDEIRAAIKETKVVTDKPTLIKVTTTIGFGSPHKGEFIQCPRRCFGRKRSRCNQTKPWTALRAIPCTR